MKCVSTRGGLAVPFRTAVREGLAPDGGLYVPATLPALPRGQWHALANSPLAEIAVSVLTPLVGDEVPENELGDLLSDALDFEVPLRQLDDTLWVLELFHGPTLAFKDVGARVLARFLAYFHADREPLTILVATSGDTGGAVAQAFVGVAGTRVVVLYPRGQVSAVQESQFTTLDGNVTALAVDGTFDDCQRLVKEAFGDPDLNRRVSLTSANSISLGRLLPQIAYYGRTVGPFADGHDVMISVPSGNFGNLAAGLMALQMGLPARTFVAPTTINDTVPRYLKSGVVSPRPSVPTLANAMDVGSPSNLERIRWMFADDVAAIRSVVSASSHRDDEVREAIHELDTRYGYVADPHTAIAYLGIRPTGGVFLATAHPAKFREVVEPVIGRPVPLPPALQAALDRPRQAIPVEARLDAIAPHIT